MQKLLWWEFGLLLFLLPLLFYPGINYFPFPVMLLGWDLRTSELFELPKSYFLYLMALIICITWGVGVLSRELPLRFRWTWVMLAYLGFGFFIQ